MTSLGKDLRILSQLLLKRERGQSHQQRLENFYSGQAEGYDAFRQRLLTGRRELVEAIPWQPGQHWLELGGGTGATLEYMTKPLSQLGEVTVLDLCQPLLNVAQARIAKHGWKHVNTVLADATSFQPTTAVDIVVMSYSLTMIPDWFAAVENAWRVLRPGGIFGIVDFYVSRRHAEAGLQQHGWITRHGWPAWFANDNVFLSPDHLPWLRRRFETIELVEWRAKIPYLPLVRVPVYRFVGRKTSVD